MHIHKYENWGKPVEVPYIRMPEREIGCDIMQHRECKRCGKVKRRKVR